MTTNPTPEELPPPASRDDETSGEHAGSNTDAGAGDFLFHQDAASILMSIFNPPIPQAPMAADEEPENATSASVKFMITAKDEKELRELGYSEAQINKLKPEEAARILEGGIKAPKEG